jgi:hypothetical protein
LGAQRPTQCADIITNRLAAQQFKPQPVLKAKTQVIIGNIGFAESIAFFRSTMIGTEKSNRANFFAVNCGASKNIRLSLIVAILEE